MKLKVLIIGSSQLLMSKVISTALGTIVRLPEEYSFHDLNTLPQYDKFHIKWYAEETKPVSSP